MKKFVLLCAAFLSLLCSCNKEQEDTQTLFYRFSVQESDRWKVGDEVLVRVETAYVDPRYSAPPEALARSGPWYSVSLRYDGARWHLFEGDAPAEGLRIVLPDNPWRLRYWRITSTAFYIDEYGLCRSMGAFGHRDSDGDQTLTFNIPSWWENNDSL